MIILGLVLLLTGYFLAIEILWVLGLVLLIIGVVLLVSGMTGHPVGGRSRWY